MEKNPTTERASATEAPLTSSAPEETAHKKARRRKHVRCKAKGCRVKLGTYLLSASLCKCKQPFCAVHMHDHRCTFDFRQEAAGRLAHHNPVVKPSRLPERL